MPIVRRTLALCAIALTAFCAVLPARANAQQPPSLTITTVDASAYPRITAVVNALDGSGVPVGGLTAESFTAFESDAPLTVDGLQAQRLSLSVAIDIDVSGSMAIPDGAPIAAAKQAAKEFVQNLGPGDAASIFAFSTDVRQVAPFTPDKAQLTAAVDGLVAAGDTSLFEAAQTAVFAVNQAPTPRKAVVLLTDGENVSPSTVTSDGSLGVARDAQVPVYSIGFGPGPDTTYLQAIAQSTNGQYRAADVGTVSAVYGDIARLLNSVYTLTLTAGSSSGSGGASLLRVIADIGGVSAEGSLEFDRPGVPVPTSSNAEPSAVGDDGSSRTPLVVYGGVVGVIVLGIMAIGAATFIQRARTRRHQLAVVAPNLAQASEQGVPYVPGTIIADDDDGAGRLVALDLDGVTRDFTSVPIKIGTGTDCDLRLPAAPEIAGRHAVVWMRDGKIMLRHTGGGRRPTLVSGRPVDWVILEDGDEFSIGAHRFRAELR
jgi:VWFA-related protein